MLISKLSGTRVRTRNLVMTAPSIYGRKEHRLLCCYTMSFAKQDQLNEAADTILLLIWSLYHASTCDHLWSFPPFFLCFFLVLYSTISRNFILEWECLRIGTALSFLLLVWCVWRASVPITSLSISRLFVCEKTCQRSWKPEMEWVLEPFDNILFWETVHMTGVDPERQLT